MRLALLSDVHGNTTALDAVLSDVERQGGADGFVVLGDLAAIGADPVGVLERVSRLPNARFVQGNTDRYLVTGERPYPSIDDAVRDPSLIRRLVEVRQSFAWTHGRLAGGGWLEWLEALRLEHREVLPDGTRACFVHVAPGENDGPGLHPGVSDDGLSAAVDHSDADLVCAGHTHWPIDRTAGTTRVVNVGSVSNPWSADLRASYVLLDATPGGYQLDFRRVAYDYAAAIEAVRRSGHPSGEYVISHFEGKRHAWWHDAEQILEPRRPATDTPAQVGSLQSNACLK